MKFTLITAGPLPRRSSDWIWLAGKDTLGLAAKRTTSLAGLLNPPTTWRRGSMRDINRTAWKNSNRYGSRSSRSAIGQRARAVFSDRPEVATVGEPPSAAGCARGAG